MLYTKRSKLDILKLSDDEIIKIADPIWDDIVKGSNEKNWNLFSKNMPSEMVTDEVRKNVEIQWDTNEILTTLTDKREFIDILRRKECVVVMWKQWSSNVDGDYLALLYLQNRDGEIKAIGSWIK